MTKHLSRKEFTDLILGKELTREGVFELLQKKYPGNNILTDRALRHRLAQLEHSPFAEIKKKKLKGVGIVYLLISVSPDFFKLNYKQAADYRAERYVHKPKSDKLRYRSPMHPVEIQYCRRRQMFDQALASVRGNT